MPIAVWQSQLPIPGRMTRGRQSGKLLGIMRSGIPRIVQKPNEQKTGFGDYEMPILFTAEGLKMLATIITSLGILGGAYVWAEGPVPATRAWTIAQVQDLRGRVVDLQLMQNIARRDQFRKEQFDLEQSLKKAPDDFSIIQRKNSVTDTLNEIESERRQLLHDRGS